MVIVLVSGKGAPGVSTSALALARVWPLRPEGFPQGPERVLVVEADPAGSSAVPGYLRGQVDPQRGMAAVMEAVLDLGDDAVGAAVREAVYAVEGCQARLLVAGMSPALMAAYQQSWPAVAGWLQGVSQSPARTDVLVDAGRLGSVSDPLALLQIADAVLVVCRASLPSVMGASHAVARLQGLADQGWCPGQVACLLIGDGPYSAADVAAALQVPVAGVLAWDPASALVFGEGRAPGRGFTRSALLRSASEAADRVVANVLPGLAGAGLPVAEGARVDA